MPLNVSLVSAYFRSFGNAICIGGLIRKRYMYRRVDGRKEGREGVTFLTH